MTPINPIHPRTQSAHDHANLPPGELQSALTNFVGVRLFSVLSRCDTRALCQLLQQKPELSLRVIHAMCTVVELSISQQKLGLHREQAKAQQIDRDEKRRQLSIRKPIFITRDTIAALDSTRRDELRESAIPVVTVGIVPAVEPGVLPGGTRACVPLREAA